MNKKNIALVLLGLLILILILGATMAYDIKYDRKYRFEPSLDYSENLDYGSKSEIYDNLIQSLKDNILRDPNDRGLKNYGSSKYKEILDEYGDLPDEEALRILRAKTGGLSKSHLELPLSEQLAYAYGKDYSDLAELFNITNSPLLPWSENNSIGDNPLYGINAKTPEEKEKYVEAIKQALALGNYKKGYDRRNKSNILRRDIDNIYKNLVSPPEQSTSGQTSIPLQPQDLEGNKEAFNNWEKYAYGPNSALAQVPSMNSIAKQIYKDDAILDEQLMVSRLQKDLKKQLAERQAREAEEAKKKAEYDAWVESLKPKRPADYDEVRRRVLGTLAD